MFIRGCPLAGRAAFLKVASLDFYRKRPRRLRRGGRPHFFPKKWGERRGRGCSPGAPRNGGSRRRWAVRTGRKPTAHCRPLRRHKFQIIRFAASGKAHSFHCLAPVAAERLPGQSGPPIAPLLFSGSLHPPLAALRRKTPLPTEPAAQPLAALPPYGCGVPLAGTSLGFGGGPVFTCVTGAAAPRAARIAVTPQALRAAALYRVRPPGRHRCHAPEIPRRSLRVCVGFGDPARLPGPLSLPCSVGRGLAPAACPPGISWGYTPILLDHSPSFGGASF